MRKFRVVVFALIFKIEQRAVAKSKEAQMRVFGLFLLLPRLASVGLIVH
jgi:hypothetical protein